MLKFSFVPMLFCQILQTAISGLSIFNFTECGELLCFLVSVLSFFMDNFWLSVYCWIFAFQSRWNFLLPNKFMRVKLFSPYRVTTYIYWGMMLPFHLLLFLTSAFCVAEHIYSSLRLELSLVLKTRLVAHRFLMLIVSLLHFGAFLVFCEVLRLL